MIKPTNHRSTKNNAGIMTHVGALIAAGFWGFSFVATKVVMVDGGLSPTEAYIYRFLMAYLVLLLLKHRNLICNNWRDEGLMLICGMCSGSLYFITENTALNLTTTTNVSLLTSTSPLLTILLIALIYKSERPGRGIVIGSIIAFAGVCCVVLNSLFACGSDSMSINPGGDLLAIASALCWAVYSLVIRRLNAVYDSWFITRKTFFYGILTAMPFLLFEPHLTNPLSLFDNPTVVFNLAFLVMCPSILAFYLWAVAIDGMGAVKANNYLYFQPLVTLVASAIVLGETVTILGYVGFILILFGLWFGDYLQARLNKNTHK